MDFAIISAVVFVFLFFTLDYLSNRYLGNDYLVNFPLLLYFAFSYANIDQEVAPYYGWMAGVILTYTLVGFAVSRLRVDNADSMKLNGTTIRGPAYYIFNIALGLGTVVFMRLLLSNQPDDKLQAFLGVPVLSLAALQSNLSYVTTMALGAIENKFIVITLKFFQTLRKVIVQSTTNIMLLIFGWIPFLNFILIPLTIFISTVLLLLGPILLSAALFAIFHLAAYNLVFGALFFAFTVMLIWLVLYMVTGNDIVMNVGHMGWNFLVTFITKTGGGLG